MVWPTLWCMKKTRESNAAAFTDFIQLLNMLQQWATAQMDMTSRNAALDCIGVTHNKQQVTHNYRHRSVIFVNENENENLEKRENNEFVNENEKMMKTKTKLKRKNRKRKNRKRKCQNSKTCHSTKVPAYNTPFNKMCWCDVIYIITYL